MFAIHNPGLALAGGFLGAGAGKKRTVEKGQLHLPGVIGNGDGEDAGVLVVHVDEINALKGFKGSPARSAPSGTNPPTSPGQFGVRSAKAPCKS
jgi:hypothetical protein